MSELQPDAAIDYRAFLLRQWPRQQALIERYEVAGEVLWLKRAGARNGRWRYWLLGAAERLLRLPVLRPVPNLGGRAAIAIELARLSDLAARGVRVPEVLAACDDAFLMRDLGVPGRITRSLGDEIEAADRREIVLSLWRLGLETLDEVHRRGTCLSQAFARNLVRCHDGIVACIDFEDDPTTVLPLPLCQLRDALAYVHSTALALRTIGVMEAARTLWLDWLTQPVRDAAFRAALRETTVALAWTRWLPAEPDWSRDIRRTRAAYELLAAPER